MSLLESLRPTPKQTRRWLANVALGYGDALVGGLVYLLLTPLLVEHLGNEGYALWIVSHTICFYLQFLDIGLSGAQIRYHARFRARNRPEDVRKLSTTIAIGMSFAGLLGAVIGTAIAFGPPHWWPEAPGYLQSDFRIALFLLSISLLVSFPGSTLNNIYQGTQRFDIRNLRSMLLKIAAAIAQFVLIQRGYGIVELVALELATISLRVLIDVIVTSRLLPDVLHSRLSFHRDIWKRIRHFAIWSFADDLLVEGTPRLDSLFIVVVLPLALLTPYSLCITIAGVLMTLVHPIIETFFPMAAAVHAESQRNHLRQMLVGGSKLCLVLATPAAIFLGFFGVRILTLWVPASGQQISIWVLPLIAVNVLVSVFLSSSATILAAINGIRTIVMLTLLEVGLTLVLILLSARSLGLVGIALSCLVTNIGVGFALQLPIVTRAVGLQLSELLYGTLLRIGVAAIPAIAVAALLALRWPNANWMQLCIFGLTTAGTFLVSMLLIGTTSAERKNYVAMYRGLYVKRQVSASFEQN